ncbi:MAG: dihydropyrimidinase [Treponema sp.]
MKTLITNGTLVTETGILKADIAINGDVITGIGFFPKKDFDNIYDVQNCLVMPGLIDAHTHLELQQSPQYRAADDFYTGTVAAACGGTTSIIDHIAFGPAGCNLHYSIDRYHELAKKAVIDYSFHGVIQHVDDAIVQELAHIIQHEGITSFKAYTTYGFKVDDTGFYRLLKTVKKAGGILTVHSENDSLINYLRSEYLKQNKVLPIYHARSRPNITESEAVARLMQFAALADDAPLYIVHLSTAEALSAVMQGRTNLKNTFVETCTQYLTLSEEKYGNENGSPDDPENIEGLKYMMAPPLRTKNDTAVLWEGVKDGSIQVIATDHCPFMLQEKLHTKGDFTKGPGGAPGIEERVRIIFSEGVQKKRITLEQFVKVMAANPARIFNLYPKKGCLLPGADADITIINPHAEEVLTKKNLKSACDYCVYEGMKVQCSIDSVFSRGTLIVKNNEFLGEKGRGQFIFRKPHATIAE